MLMRMMITKSKMMMRKFDHRYFYKCIITKMSIFNIKNT